MLTTLFIVTILYLNILWKNLYENTWTPWSLNNLKGILAFWKLSFSGLVTICSEWWGFEIHILVSGLFGEAQLGAMTMVLNLMGILYYGILGISMGTTVYVGNAVGEKNIPLAILRCRVSIVFTVIFQITQIIIFYATDSFWPRIFTDDTDIIALVHQILPFVCLSLFPDAVQNIMGGILRGAGKLHAQACVNLIGYYFIGIGFGLFLALYFDLSILGQWLGLACANIFSAIVTTIIYLNLSWSKIIEESVSRLSETTFSFEDKLEIEMDTFETSESSISVEDSPENSDSEKNHPDPLETENML